MATSAGNIMEKLANATENLPDREFDNGMWMAGIVTTAVACGISVYIVVALLYYEISICRRQSGRGVFRNRESEKFSFIARSLCIITASLATAFHSVKILSLCIEKMSWGQFDAYQNLSKICLHTGKSVDVLILATLSSGYLFLWARQRVFYLHPALKALKNTCLEMTSYALLIVWIIFNVGAIAAYIIQVEYGFFENVGCYIFKGRGVLFYTIISTLAFCIVMQISLLILFVYPLTQRTRIAARQGALSPSSRKMFRLVKKLVILAGVCTVTDITSVVMSIMFALFREGNTFFTYSVNITINLLALIGCFDYWKRMLFPWVLAANPVREGSMVQSRRSTDVTYAASAATCESKV